MIGAAPAPAPHQIISPRPIGGGRPCYRPAATPPERSPIQGKAGLAPSSTVDPRQSNEAVRIRKEVMTDPTQQDPPSGPVRAPRIGGSSTDLTDQRSQGEI